MPKVKRVVMKPDPSESKSKLDFGKVRMAARETIQERRLREAVEKEKKSAK